MEALLFGKAGLLEGEKEDNYFKDLQFRYFYLLHKYQLSSEREGQVQFFKHRPDNFPTIRLSQLAHLYHLHQNLFSKISSITTIEGVYELFQVRPSEYWETHYQFDRESPKKTKKLSKSFADLLLINTIVPVQFAYAKSVAKEISDDLISILSHVAPEKNSIVDKFQIFGLRANNSFETQSLLQLKNEYCAYGKCLDCAIGMELLKKN